MSEEFLDEVTSINSIYGEETLVSAGDNNQSIFSLTIPSQPAIAIRIEFPETYPDVPPSILGTQSIGSDIPKGQGQEFVNLVRDVLAEVYAPGTPCIFDLVETAGERLQSLGLDTESSGPGKETQASQGTGTATPPVDDNGYPGYSDLKFQETSISLEIEPPWILSDAAIEKKSVFVARSAYVTSVDEAKSYVAHLLTTDKKAAKATHNITAWRIRGQHGVQFQDCDDDGETAAGGRLLHLLELMGVWNVMVVVTRWYGGVHLGPDRFRIINQVAREAIVRGDFGPEKEGAERGKGKRK
ncbi:UPF0029-domain-containing protein [Polychaeton citri CBS 116435]|uniref:UPF0029-domain-containing protein n=1 Tax=Polychaeton citri CBS 116435 TaxID=1314669 RepID=A0A9P4QHY3_9PEZI|nr:UPF0029-domain-containing protein [Polychaeton citri CBS 116435]